MNSTFQSNATQGPLISRHARIRQQQRGISDADVRLVRSYGEQVADGFLMTDLCAQRRLAELRNEMRQLERVRGVAVIEDAGTVITVLRADKLRARMLRQQHVTPVRRQTV